MTLRIRESMNVYGANGNKVGKVGRVVVGESSREARFFTIEKGFLFTTDYLVPREAVTRVDENGAHIALTEDQVERLPEYRGEAPTAEDARRAYEALGARREEHGYTFGSVPFAGSLSRESVGTSSARGRLGFGREERGAVGRAGTGSSVGAPDTIGYAVQTEPYLVLTPEERERMGYRSEWEHRER